MRERCARTARRREDRAECAERRRSRGSAATTPHLLRRSRRQTGSWSDTLLLDQFGLRGRWNSGNARCSSRRAARDRRSGLEAHEQPCREPRRVALIGLPRDCSLRHRDPFLASALWPPTCARFPAKKRHPRREAVVLCAHGQGSRSSTQGQVRASCEKLGQLARSMTEQRACETGEPKQVRRRAGRGGRAGGSVHLAPSRTRLDRRKEREGPCGDHGRGAWASEGARIQARADEETERGQDAKGGRDCGGKRGAAGELSSLSSGFSPCSCSLSFLPLPRFPTSRRRPLP